MDLALFDFDGTITSKESWGPFIRRATPTHRRWLGLLVVLPVLAGYRAKLVSGTVIRSTVLRVAFRGLERAKVEATGKEFADTHLPGVLRSDVMGRIAWHRERGDRVIVVSGALDVYLSHWCKQHQLELMCSSLESRNGVLTGRHRGAQCVGEEKARRIREVVDLDSYSMIHAYGDTKEDLAMLALAHRRYYRGVEVA